MLQKINSKEFEKRFLIYFFGFWKIRFFLENNKFWFFIKSFQFIQDNVDYNKKIKILNLLKFEEFIAYFNLYLLNYTFLKIVLNPAAKNLAESYQFTI